jgi:hypothetical protein
MIAVFAAITIRPNSQVEVLVLVCQKRNECKPHLPTDMNV